MTEAKFGRMSFREIRHAIKVLKGSEPLPNRSFSFQRLYLRTAAS